MLIVVMSVSVFFVACAQREILAPRDGVVPIGVDFSGHWQVQSDERGDRRKIREAIRRTDGIKDEDLFRTVNPDGQSRSSKVKGGLVFVFLETGVSLRVTQNEHGMFISFDRSVVEEYRFGENRVISVGDVEAQRVTGWEGQQLIVETLDRNSMKMTERFKLLQSGRVLERSITFRSREGEEETVVQRYHRLGT